MRTLFILLLASGAAAAQDEPPTFRAGVSVVQVDVAVVEGKRLIRGLTAADFVVTDEGVPQTVSYFGSERESLRLVLVLDISGSMHRYLGEMASVARKTLRLLTAEDQAAVIVFTRGPRLTQDFTNDWDMVASRINSAREERGLGSGTAINHAVLEAAHVLGRETARPGGRRAVVILTDNNCLNYRIPDEQVIDALNSANAVLNAIVVGRVVRRKDPPKGHYVNPDFTPADVFRLAAETGGEAISADRADAAFGEILERIRARYSLHYPAPAATPGSFRRIRVQLAPAARQAHPGAQVRARSGYTAR